MQRNEFGKKKTALGDIKNYVPVTPAMGSDNHGKKQLKNDFSSDQATCSKSADHLDLCDYLEMCSSQPVNYKKEWMERITLSDEEVNKFLSNGFYERDDDCLRPPPPSPLEDFPLESMDAIARVTQFKFSKTYFFFFFFFLVILGLEDFECDPPCLDYIESLPLEVYVPTDEAPELNNSVFELSLGLSELELSTDENQTCVGRKMHF